MALPHALARLVALSIAVLLTVLLTTGAWAQEPDWKTRAAARKLGVEGIQLENQGKFAEALDRFERAQALYPAPTLGVRTARCLEKLGRLVEAAERYREVATADLGPSPQFQYRQAQAEAKRERAALLPRIPELEVVVKGDRAEGITVLVDNEILPPELIDAAHPVDPGQHEVRVRRGDVTITETTTVAEGETARVVLKLPALPLPPPPPEQAAELDFEMLMWVSYGVGAGGVLAGIINGSVALSQRGHLEERCPARVCPPSAHDAADAYDATRAATTIGFVIGGLGLAAGTALYFFAPATEPADEAPALEASLGPLGGALSGRF